MITCIFQDPELGGLVPAVLIANGQYNTTIYCLQFGHSCGTS